MALLGRQMLKDHSEEIIKQFVSGATQQEIAEKYSVTRAAVSLLLKKLGVSSSSGGVKVKIKHKEAARLAARDKKCVDKHGFTYKELKTLRNSGVIYACSAQKRNAKCRGIGWELTLKEWVDIWEKSGKFAFRGIARGQYVMARHMDKGPYKADNVSIKLSIENIKEGYKFKKELASIA